MKRLDKLATSIMEILYNMSIFVMTTYIVEDDYVKGEYKNEEIKVYSCKEIMARIFSCPFYVGSCRHIIINDYVPY